MNLEWIDADIDVGFVAPRWRKLVRRWHGDGSSTNHWKVSVFSYMTGRASSQEHRTGYSLSADRLRIDDTSRQFESAPYHRMFVRMQMPIRNALLRLPTFDVIRLLSRISWVVQCRELPAIFAKSTTRRRPLVFTGHTGIDAYRGNLGKDAAGVRAENGPQEQHACDARRHSADGRRFVRRAAFLRCCARHFGVPQAFEALSAG